MRAFSASDEGKQQDCKIPIPPPCIPDGDQHALRGPVNSMPQMALKLSVETQEEFWWAFQDENRGVAINEYE